MIPLLFPSGRGTSIVPLYLPGKTPPQNCFVAGSRSKDLSALLALLALAAAATGSTATAHGDVAWTGDPAAPPADPTGRMFFLHMRLVVQEYL